MNTYLIYLIGVLLVAAGTLVIIFGQRQDGHQDSTQITEAVQQQTEAVQQKVDRVLDAIEKSGLDTDDPVVLAKIDAVGADFRKWAIGYLDDRENERITENESIRDILNRWMASHDDREATIVIHAFKEAEQAKLAEIADRFNSKRTRQRNESLDNAESQGETIPSVLDNWREQDIATLEAKIIDNLELATQANARSAEIESSVKQRTAEYENEMAELRKKPLSIKEMTDRMAARESVAKDDTNADDSDPVKDPDDTD